MSDLKILAAELIIILAAALILTIVTLLLTLGKYRRLKRQERMKLSLLRNLSHEIRTPLHTVSGLAEIIADENLYLSKSEKKNLSDQIKNGANLAATLLHELVVFSEEGTQEAYLHKETISPNYLCNRCVNAHQEEASAAKLSLVFQKTIGDDFTLTTDPRVLELILNKLICSAIRFTNQGSITVGCNTTENIGNLTIYVEDTGCGIPEEREDKLFDWFEHPENVTDEAELDLSLAQKLAARMGGGLRHDRHYKQGTRMLCILPL